MPLQRLIGAMSQENVDSAAILDKRLTDLTDTRNKARYLVEELKALLRLCAVLTVAWRESASVSQTMSRCELAALPEAALTGLD
jgi:hypothetical protein